MFDLDRPRAGVRGEISFRVVAHDEGRVVGRDSINYVGESARPVNNHAARAVSRDHLFWDSFEGVDVERNAVVEEAVTATQHRALIAERRPGQSGARRDA